MPELASVVVTISARQEWLAVKNLRQPAAVQTSPYGEWFDEPLEDGSSLIFFQSGWGKTNAAGSTQYLIDHWHPRLLINLGTCGGFAGHIQTGEIILVEKSIIYDIYEQMVAPEVGIAAYTTELDLSWLQEPYPQPVRRTLLVSADRDLDPAEIESLHTHYGAVAGDWETGSIAFICKKNRLPCLILRGVSDLVHAEGGGEAYNNIELFASRTRVLFADLLSHLHEWITCSKIPL
jgi:adenosylhomocysteine nucleosidase